MDSGTAFWLHEITQLGSWSSLWVIVLPHFLQQTVSTALSIILYISSFGWKFVWSQLNWIKHFNWRWSWPITKTLDWAIPGLCTSYYLLSLSKGHKLRIWLWVDLTLQSTVRPSMSFQGFTMGPNQLFIHEWSHFFIFAYLAKRTQNASGHYPC